MNKILKSSLVLLSFTSLLISCKKSEAPEEMNPQFATDYPAVEAKFSQGQRVRVREAAPLGHIRTPFYIPGHVGEIERLCGSFPNPEELAQMRDGLPAQPLYRVRFKQQDVWPLRGGIAFFRRSLMFCKDSKRCPQ